MNIAEVSAAATKDTKNIFISAEFIDALFECGVKKSDEYYDMILPHVIRVNALTDFKKIYNARRDIELRAENKLDDLREVQVFAFREIPYKTAGIYQMDETGIAKYNDKALKWENVFPHPIIISERYEDVLTGEKSVKIKYFDDGKTSEFVCRAESTATVQGIQKLASKIQVNAINAFFLIDFLSRFITINKELLPTKRITSVLGWHGDEFIPYSDDVHCSNTDEFPFLGAIKPKGDYTKWKEYVQKCCENDIFRIYMAASFGSVLLKLIKKPNFIVNVYGSTGKTGKTAALKCALSVWGDPEKIKCDWNTTIVGAEQMAAGLKNIPMSMNESELLRPSRGLFMNHADFVYMFCEGQTRTRGAKTGGNQDKKYWNSICLSNGEGSILTENSREGEINRILEFNADRRIVGNSTEDTIEIVNFCKENYGHAGKEFVQNCTKYDINEIWHMVFGIIKSFGTEKQTGELACLLCGDLLRQMIIFGVPEREAWSSVSKFIDRIKGNIKKDSDIDITDRAVEFIYGWISQNAFKFARKYRKRKDYEEDPDNGYRVSGECFGVIDEDENIFVINGVLNNMLTENGFNTKKTVADMVERGIISPSKSRKDHPVRIPYAPNPVRCYKIVAALP